MKINKNQFALPSYKILGLFVPLALFACSTGVRRVDLPPGSDPQPKLAETQARLEADQEKQFDMLSPRHFLRAQECLSDAHKKTEKGEPSNKILEDIGQAMAELQVVEENSQKNSGALQTVLLARNAARIVKANSAFPNEFKSTDEQLQAFGEQIEDGEFQPDSKKVSALEGRYSDLELQSIKLANLGGARSLLEKCENAGAEKKTPQSYTAAKIQYASAIRAIEGNRHNPEKFSQVVLNSVKSAEKLDRVLKTVSGTNASEAVAIQLDNQQLQLAANESSLRDADSKAKKIADATALANQETEAREKTGRLDLMALKDENQQYAEKVALNQKIETIKSEFTPEEAEVVRDGKKIVIRLKSMKFSSARFDLTTSSLDTLQKVKEMIAAVPVSNVVVEGHTDAIGGAAKNRVLSQNRAEAVRKYFIAEKSLSADQVEAKGVGYDRPLTTNKTKAGRATNRRVDVIIESTSTM